jgi:ketosteroid isomerase-like protein
MAPSSGKANESGSITPSEARELFQRRRQAWLASDAEAYMALWAEDMRIKLPGRAEPIRGKAAYSRVIEESMRHMRPVSWEFHRLAVDGDHVLAEWTIEGEYIAREKLVRWSGMSVCRIEDGLIHEWREYWDPAAVRA